MYMERVMIKEMTVEDVYRCSVCQLPTVYRLECSPIGVKFVCTKCWEMYGDISELMQV